MPTQNPPPPTKTIRHGRKGQVLWQQFSLILTLKNLCSLSLKQNRLKCSSLCLRSIKKSSVTSRLSKILKWLFFSPFIWMLKNLLSSNPAAMEWSLSRTRIMCRNYFFFPSRFIRMQVWSLSFRELSHRKLCRWLFRCLKKGKRHVSTQHGKRSFQEAGKLKIYSLLQWIVRNQVSLCYNL